MSLVAGGDGTGLNRAPLLGPATSALPVGRVLACFGSGSVPRGALMPALPAGTLSCPGWTSAAAAGWRCRRSRRHIGPAGNSGAAGSSVHHRVVPMAAALSCLLVDGGFSSSVTPVLFFWVLQHVSRTCPPVLAAVSPAAPVSYRPRLPAGCSSPGGQWVNPRPCLPILPVLAACRSSTRCPCLPAADVRFILDVWLRAAGGSTESAGARPRCRGVPRPPAREAASCQDSARCCLLVMFS